MRIFLTVDGTPIAAARGIDPGDPPVFPAHAIGYAGTFDFDEETNVALVDAVAGDVTAYRVIAGVLTKDGAAVTVAAPGRFIQDRDRIQQSLGQLDTLITRLDGGTDLTAAQRQEAFLFLLRAVRYILRWIVRRG
jgi:hypothetical protein